MARVVHEDRDCPLGQYVDEDHPHVLPGDDPVVERVRVGRARHDQHDAPIADRGTSGNLGVDDLSIEPADRHRRPSCLQRRQRRHPRSDVLGAGPNGLVRLIRRTLAAIV
jgi:hypothetical protein